MSEALLQRLYFRWKLPWGGLYLWARMQLEAQRSERMLTQLAQAPDMLALPGDVPPETLMRFEQTVAVARAWAASRPAAG